MINTYARHTPPRTAAVVFFSLILGVILLVPAYVSASSVIRVDDTVSVSNEQVVEGDFYGIAPTVAVSGSVVGDAYLLGGRMTLNGNVASDTVAVGLAADFHGEAGDDVRVMAGEVTVAGHVKGDLVVVAGQLKVLSTAQIDGDIVFFGGEMEVAGAVGKQVMGRMTSARIDGPVAGDVIITVGSLVLGENASVSGMVQYSSARELMRAQNATVGGDIVQNLTPAPSTQALFRTALELMLPILFAALTWLLIFRGSLERLVITVTRGYIRTTLIGVGVAVAVPIAAAVLVLSTLGVLLGIVLFAVYVVLICAAFVGAGSVVGEALRLWFTPAQPFGAWWVLVGTVLVAALLLVPLGAPLVIFLIILTLGGLSERLYTALR